MDHVIAAFALTLFPFLPDSAASLPFSSDGLSIALLFCAGVMIFVSMIGMMVEAPENFIHSLGKVLGNCSTLIAFVLGIFSRALI